jgi:ABC-2 type transport system ATP-binding protein
MEEADRLCDRIAIIDHGKIIALDTPQNLKTGIGGDIIIIKTPDTATVFQVLAMPWILRLEQQAEEIRISLQNAEQHISDIITILNRHNIPILCVSIHKPTLEDVFLSCTGKKIRDGEIDKKEMMRMHKKMGRH